MGSSLLIERDRWLARFGSERPAFAAVLLDGAAQGRLADVRAGAEALGVLRAQEGHAVAGLVEDLLALRGVCPDTERLVDVALSLAVSAYVDELSALLTAHATRDPLTGLPNRAAFDEALEHEIAAASRGPAPSLLLLDLDKFKQVNDTEGHLAGDAVLVAVASVLRDNVRPSDIACRLGGDEFAVVLPRTNAARALQVARRLLAAARRDPELVGKVTLSVGIGHLEAPADPTALVARADAALYEVKATGGDGVR